MSQGYRRRVRRSVVAPVEVARARPEASSEALAVGVLFSCGFVDRGSSLERVLRGGRPVERGRLVHDRLGAVHRVLDPGLLLGLEERVVLERVVGHVPLERHLVLERRVAPLELEVLLDHLREQRLSVDWTMFLLLIDRHLPASLTPCDVCRFTGSAVRATMTPMPNLEATEVAVHARSDQRRAVRWDHLAAGSRAPKRKLLLAQRAGTGRGRASRRC